MIVGFVGFELLEFKNFEELAFAISDGMFPIVDVLTECFHSSEIVGPHHTHIMVATGIRNENELKCIQLQNSYADNANAEGKVHSELFDSQKETNSFFELFKESLCIPYEKNMMNAFYIAFHF